MFTEYLLDYVVHGHERRYGETDQGMEHCITVWRPSYIDVLSPIDRLKYYTVNDVQFDPTVYVPSPSPLDERTYLQTSVSCSSPTRLVSSGHDRMVRIWDCGGLERGARPRLRQTGQSRCEF